VKLDYIRAEGKARRISTQMMAIVVDCGTGRDYVEPIEEQTTVANLASPKWLPDSTLPTQALGFRVQGYGLTKHSDLFTKRQLTTLSTYSDLVAEACEVAIADGAQPEYANALATYLAFGLSRLTDIQNSLCMWESSKTQVRHLFTRQAVPMLWDFAEGNTFSNSAGDYAVSLGSAIKVIERTSTVTKGTAAQRDAAGALYSREYVFSTDPPYYDNIGYADLSDFFYIWLRGSLSSI
jgi:putative DNA methylase